MSYNIIASENFAKSLKSLAKRYRSMKSDYAALLESLEQNPLQGVELRPGIRKIRMSITSKGRGKSGGARVITYNVITSEIEGIVYLIDIYDKSDASTVDINIIQKYVDEINSKVE